MPEELCQQFFRKTGDRMADIERIKIEKIRINVQETRVNWSTAPYYKIAEAHMETQWDRIIYPLIRGYDFSKVLELAPGHGRNTEKLKDLAGEIHLVDVNKTCIEACKKRFKDYNGSCKFFYYVNDGHSMRQIEDESITFIYSWDSMVHFDKFVIEQYINEFYRVLRPGGCGFVHHSNYGAMLPDTESHWLDNPHWRSNMSRELFAQYCSKTELVIEKQQLLKWGEVDNLDCISIFRKVPR